MKKKIKRLLPLTSICILPFLALFYPLVNHAGSGDVYSLESTFDKAIPFSPIFAVPYLLWTAYIYGTLIYFFFKDKKTYFKALFTYAAGLVICYAIYSFFQTTVGRPIVVGTAFPENLVLWIYENDAPFNAFPSIHCFTSYLMIRIVTHSPILTKWNYRIILTSSSLIILSTLLVKQHVLLDVMGALLLAEAVCFLAERNWATAPAMKTKREISQ
ncbi:hypothetical protein A374_07819 [Fictibacillus macauensis ZFHKF-1]|uniref:Uncharacterized protein n=1 Tax=Fictibacillus macauensis ZFHKF-1 TaxID=1196324 RepID=I8UFQ5_9BACL|nr:phosphatase PAP2 family protein [Fictibacillus macauensis]EIT85725.1 hypothetical protein A374_07819 [Fictibacillus macauensis ZFHKF-1]